MLKKNQFFIYGDETYSEDPALDGCCVSCVKKGDEKYRNDEHRRKNIADSPFLSPVPGGELFPVSCAGCLLFRTESGGVLLLAEADECMRENKSKK